MNYLKSAACPCMYFYQSLGKWMIFVVLFVISSGVMGQKVIESNLLGNWANTGTGAWEYGFYEDGAIVFSDFWKYKHVKFGRKQTEVVLENGNRTVVLKIKQGKNGNISIVRDNEKGEIFHPCNGKDFVAWEGVDTVSFSKPLVITDTVTIRGYIRNLDKVTHPALRGYTFTCGYNGLLEEEEGEIVAPVDSSGRFTLRFVVSAPQRVLLEWGRMWKNIIVEPGETVLLYADASDWKVFPDVSKEEMINGKKDVLFMGKNARFHQEYTCFPYPLWMRNMYELREIARSDMEFLRLAEADYLKSVAFLDSICGKYPNLSKRCKESIENEWKYRFAATLMQNQFNLRGSHERFDPGYMEYVNTHFSVNESLYYFITRDYQTFLRDYTGYVDSQKYRYVDGIGLVYMPDDRLYEVLRRLKEGGMFGELSTEDIATCERISRKMTELSRQQITDTSAFQVAVGDKAMLYDKMNTYRSLPEVRELEEVVTREHELLLYDTLVSDVLLKELCYTRLFVTGMEYDHKSLAPGMMNLVDARISNPVLNRKVKEASAVYQKIASKKLAYEASLIDVERFSHISDADSLWQALIEPYRGNVILFDFWGSWCEPCKDMLALMGDIEKVFENEKVIFMYFAYSSPEETWKNVIKEFNLTGKNIVHYNLPPLQQQMIVKKMEVHGYPTYKIIDKAGNVTSRVLEYPLRPQSVINEIRAELNHR